MKDEVFERGRSSCRCPKCSSLNVYYSLQYPIEVNVSPSNKLLRFNHKTNSDTIRTSKETALILTSEISSTECNLAHLCCRDCGLVKQVLPTINDEEEVTNG